MDMIERPSGRQEEEPGGRRRWARDRLAGALLRFVGGWSAMLGAVLILAWLGDPGSGETRDASREGGMSKATAG
jgi:hypothetical protein